MPHYNLPHNHGQNIEKVLNKMPSAEGFKDISFLFQQLGDPTRLRILWLLDVYKRQQYWLPVVRD